MSFGNLTADGTPIFTKFGPKSNHPVGSRRLNLTLVKFINKTYSKISGNASLLLSESHSLGTKRYEKEVTRYQTAELERINAEIKNIIMKDCDK